MVKFIITEEQLEVVLLLPMNILTKKQNIQVQQVKNILKIVKIQDGVLESVL